MLEFFLIGLMVYYAPIPWLVLWAHISSMRHKNIKRILYFTCVTLWIALGVLAYQYNELISGAKFEPQNALIVLGIITIVAALIIEVLSRKALGTGRIMGGSEFNKTSDQLITTGIYKYARHPRHVEHPLWFVGFGLIFANTAMLWFSVYLLLGLLIATHFEEKELLMRYGKEYLEYKKKTPAFFIPFRI